MTSCYGPSVVWNTISRFHMIALNVSGVSFSQNYILWHPLHSGRISDPQTITARIAFMHKIWTLLHRYKGVSKVQNDHPAPLTHLNPKSVGSTDCRGLLLCQVSSHSDQGFSFYRANMHTHHRRQPRRGCRGRIPTNILVGGDIITSMGMSRPIFGVAV